MFGNDEAAYCPLTYAVTIPVAGAGWMTALPSGRGSSWQTDTNVNVAVHEVTVTATGPEGVSKDVIFKVTLTPDCTF